jgi:hypothetical protein
VRLRRSCWTVFSATALDTLRALSSFLHASIASLNSAATGQADANGSAVNGSSPSASTSSAPLATIISDLHSLFALVSKETTSLSLAFAPPNESWDAVEGTAKKLHDLSSKLTFGLGLLRQRTAGEGLQEDMLAKQWRLSTMTVLECLQELCDTCITIYTGLGDKNIKPEQRKHILTNTSLIWKSVEKTASLPSDEQTAFSISWKQLCTTYEDALEEVEELTRREIKGKGKAVDQDEQEDAHASDDSDLEDEDEDEDEDEFDFDDQTPVTEDELERIKAAYHLMKLVKALLRKIDKLPPASIPYGQIHAVGEIVTSLQDDLASALHPPHDAQEVRKELATIRKLCELVTRSLGQADLERSMSQATIDKSKSTAKSQDGVADGNMAAKWLLACQTHIDKANTVLEGTLA